MSNRSCHSRNSASPTELTPFQFPSPFFHRKKERGNKERWVRKSWASFILQICRRPVCRNTSDAPSRLWRMVANRKNRRLQHIMTSSGFSACCRVSVISEYHITLLAFPDQSTIHQSNFPILHHSIIPLRPTKNSTGVIPECFYRESTFQNRLDSRLEHAGMTHLGMFPFFCDDLFPTPYSSSPPRYR